MKRRGRAPEQWLRIRVIADRDSPFTVIFEPTGMTYDLAGGEEMIADVEQPALKEMQVINIQGGISIWPPGSVVTRDAEGNELHRLN